MTAAKLFWEPEDEWEAFQCFANDEECEEAGNWYIEGGEHDGERVCTEHKHLITEGS